MSERTFQIYCYDSDTDAKPRMQRIDVEFDGSERMLLDALMKLNSIDPSINFHRSGREGVCGSDAMSNMTQFFKQYHSIKPYLVNENGACLGFVDTFTKNDGSVEWEAQDHRRSIDTASSSS